MVRNILFPIEREYQLMVKACSPIPMVIKSVFIMLIADSHEITNLARSSL